MRMCGSAGLPVAPITKRSLPQRVKAVGGLSCSIKILCKLRGNMSKSMFESFQPLIGKSHAGWDHCTGCSQADRHKDLVSHVAFNLRPRTNVA